MAKSAVKKTPQGAVLGGIHPSVRQAAKDVLSEGQVEMTERTAKAIIKRNALMQEWMRTKLQFDVALKALDDIDQILAQNWRKLDRVQLAALKMRADIQMAKINKLLPDAKDMLLPAAGEKSGNDDQPEWLSRIDEAKQRLHNLLADATAVDGTAEDSESAE